MYRIMRLVGRSLFLRMILIFIFVVPTRPHVLITKKIELFISACTFFELEAATSDTTHALVPFSASRFCKFRRNTLVYINTIADKIAIFTALTKLIAKFPDEDITTSKLPESHVDAHAYFQLHQFTIIL